MILLIDRVDRFLFLYDGSAHKSMKNIAICVNENIKYLRDQEVFLETSLNPYSATPSRKLKYKGIVKKAQAIS